MPVNDTRGSLRRAWGAIESEIQENHRLRLRDAHNVIGFRLFPIGWNWKEYPLRSRDKLRDFESRSQDASRLGLALDHSTALREGLDAQERAQAYRRQAARHFLYRAIERQEVRLIIADAEARGRFASASDVLDETFRLKVETSGVEIRGYSDSAQIDGLDLIVHLNKSKTLWDAPHKKYDWLLVERIFRDLIDHSGFTKSANQNSLPGSTLSDQELIRLCEDRYCRLPNSKNASSVNKTKAAEMASRLRTEYTFSV